MAGLVPQSAACVEMVTEADAAEAELFAEEAAIISGAAAKRRAEFATVRVCARRALAELGVPPAPILPGERRAPQWPSGVVGSLTHCAAYRAAVVARTVDVITVGVDSEPHAPLPEGVIESVSIPAERDALATLAAANPAICWDRLLFCAKEAVYKAWFPLTSRWLDFSDAEVTLAHSGAFGVRLFVPHYAGVVTGLTGWSGRWQVRDGLIFAVVSQPARSTGKVVDQRGDQFGK